MPAQLVEGPRNRIAWEPGRDFALGRGFRFTGNLQSVGVCEAEGAKLLMRIDFMDFLLTFDWLYTKEEEANCVIVLDTSFEGTLNALEKK